MGKILIKNLGKAYKQYPNRLSRLLEWISPFGNKYSTHKWILRNINFNVEPGEAVGVIGVNGAGKSTLLKIITGSSQPTEGTVDLTGNVAALLELGMGFHPDFTGRQNVVMAGQLLGLSQKLILSLMSEIESFAEIGDYIDQPVRIYSSGMQVRLAFSIATAVRPDILIVDEALSVGDAHFQHKCFSRIRSFQSKGTTLLFVSHDLAAVRALCDKAVWIDKGVVRHFGKAGEVLDSYAKAIYSKDQDVDSEPNYEIKPKNNDVKTRRDCRLDFINNSNLRNDLEIFTFEENVNSWGDAKATIVDVKICDADANSLSWMIGGEDVVLTINGRVSENLNNVFVGFMVRDRLGQNLFGDNTYLSYIDNPVDINHNRSFSAKFHFQLPILGKGSYSVTAAIASGSQQKHVIHQWINDALFFESHNERSINGLVGVPMHDVKIIIE